MRRFAKLTDLFLEELDREGPLTLRDSLNPSADDQRFE